MELRPLALFHSGHTVKFLSLYSAYPKSLQNVFKERGRGTSLVVQWLRLHAPNAEDLSSSPGQGTRSHRLQLGPGVAK